MRAFAVYDVVCGVPSGCGGFLADMVDKVVHMQRVARAEHALNLRFKRLVHHRAAGDGVHSYAHGARELVFRYKAAG